MTWRRGVLARTCCVSDEELLKWRAWRVPVATLEVAWPGSSGNLQGVTLEVPTMALGRTFKVHFRHAQGDVPQLSPWALSHSSSPAVEFDGPDGELRDAPREKGGRPSMGL